MHELPVTERVLDIIVKHAERNHVSRVFSITLHIGDLSDLENEWVQHYFDYLSKDTVAEGAKLKIEKVPVVLKCNRCEAQLQIRKDQLGAVDCPKCGAGGNFSLVSGKEYCIKEMEAM